MNQDKIHSLMNDFIENKSIENAMKLGKELTTSDMTIERKKKIYADLFGLVSDESLEAMLNLWAVASMIEDDLPISRKILAVRGFIDDPSIKSEWIEEWIEIVWNKRAVSPDFLEFIAIDLRNIPSLREDLKKMLFDEMR